MALCLRWDDRPTIMAAHQFACSGLAVSRPTKLRLKKKGKIRLDQDRRAGGGRGGTH